jgi:hypothetical protein
MRSRLGRAGAVLGFLGVVALLVFAEHTWSPTAPGASSSPSSPPPVVLKNATTVNSVNWTILHEQNASDCPKSTSEVGSGFVAAKGTNVTLDGPGLGYCWNSIDNLTQVNINPAEAGDFQLTSWTIYSHGVAWWVLTLIVLVGNTTIPDLGIELTSHLDANGR